MKVRKKNLCGTCRKRKLQCDGKRPACTQCLFSNRECEGYPDALFVPFVATKPAVKPRSPRTSPVPRPTHSLPASAECSFNADPGPIEAQDLPSLCQRTNAAPAGLPPTYQIYSEGLSTIQERVTLVLRNYIPFYKLELDTADSCEQTSWFCGSWAMALPELCADMTGPFSQCLHSAVSALSLSITAYRTRENLLDTVSTQYEDSLSLLGYSLVVAGNTYRSKLAAAVMCLALLEVLLPIQPSSWLVHVEGVSKMVQLSSPTIFASGVEHTMFIGFRPLLILKAFILRKATFFADDSWVTLPFQRHQAGPLQDLLGVAARIPAILEKIDAVLPDPFDAAARDAAARDAKQLVLELMQSITQLQVRHASFLKSTSEPLYWHCTVERDFGNRFESLWYQNLSIANVFIYFWAFHLICLIEIGSLSDQFPELKNAVLHDAAYSPKFLRDKCIELSTRIYQSIEYVLQEDFMLYGVSSAGFPLQIACKTLQLDSKGQAILATLDDSIIIRSKL